MFVTLIMTFIFLFSLVYTFTPARLYFLFTFFSVSIFFSILPLFSSALYIELGRLVVDPLTLTLTYVTVLVIICSLFSYSFKTSLVPVYLTFSSLLVSSLLVFSTNNIFILYVSYEASLIPISYAIIKWGAYPERGYSAILMLIFTSVFTFPFIVLLLNIILNIYCSPCFYFSSLLGEVMPGFIVPLIVLAFVVKLPLYGLHYWLPIAHVEAPTFGSIILAGLLLNIGGCGLIRFLPLLSSWVEEINQYSLGYLLVSIIAVAVICCTQADINRLVAYSSVLHISIVCLLLVANTSLSMSTALMLIVFHGLSSPLLFFLVGTVYSIYKTRLLISLHSLLLVSPLLAFFTLLTFLVNVPVPPVPSFLSEVLLFVSSAHLSSLILVLAVGVIFCSIVYSLSWFIPLLFSSSLFSPLHINVGLSVYLIHFVFSAVTFGFILFIDLF